MNFQLVRELFKKYFVAHEQSAVKNSFCTNVWSKLDAFFCDFLYKDWTFHRRKYWRGLAFCKVAWYAEHFYRHSLKCCLHHATFYVASSLSGLFTVLLWEKIKVSLFSKIKIHFYIRLFNYLIMLIIGFKILHNLELEIHKILGSIKSL